MLALIIKIKGQIFLSLEGEKKHTKLLWLSYIKIVTEKKKKYDQFVSYKCS